MGVTGVESVGVGGIGTGFCAVGAGTTGVTGRYPEEPVTPADDGDAELTLGEGALVVALWGAALGLATTSVLGAAGGSVGGAAGGAVGAGDAGTRFGVSTRLNCTGFSMAWGLGRLIEPPLSARNTNVTSATISTPSAE